MSAGAGLFRPRLAHRRRLGTVFSAICLAMATVGLVILLILLVQVVLAGCNRLDWGFLQRFPSIIFPEKSGIKNALWGTIWIVGLTALFAVPTGVGAAVYLQEYAGDNRFTRFIHLNITNLAGVPSIVYGILGLAIFVRWCGMGRSLIAGALTMAVLILPVIIIATQEALAAVPNTIRLAAYSLGATRWQVVWHHVLPSATPAICTGVILSLSRAIGETAPLILIGALTWVMTVPTGPMSAFTVLPIQIFNWAGQPQKVYHELAAAAIIVLLAVLLTMNALAIAIRGLQQRKKAQ